MGLVREKSTALTCVPTSASYEFTNLAGPTCQAECDRPLVQPGLLPPRLHRLAAGRRRSPDLEIVIVDDGSQDDTRTVVESLGAGIRYLYHENRGLSAARNTGILASTGKYLAYLDSDDFWLPEVAPRLLDFLDRHPGVGAVFTDARVGNPESGYTSWIQAAGQQAFLDLPAAEVETGFRILETLPFYRGMIQRNAVFTGAIIQRRELVIEAGLFEPELKATGDWELWLRMIHRTRFAYYPEARWPSTPATTTT